MDRSFFRLVTIHAFDRQTDGQTDRQTDRQLSQHSLQRGKKILSLVKVLTLHVAARCDRSTSHLPRAATGII